MQIAADTKYWLWINDSLVIREGGLKWGPMPAGFYFDETDVAPFLKAGKNEIAVLVWHFGKHGFSHKSSGRAGLWLQAEAIDLATDFTWQGALHPAFQRETTPPHPNYRLAESNIRFDARGAEASEHSDAPLFGLPATSWQPVATFQRDGYAGVPRPIPFWKDYGLKPFAGAPDFPLTSRGDTLVLALPYNAQVTPWFDIEAPAGLKVDIRTDNYRGGSEYNLRTEYVTRAGRQSFETPAWINGHEVRYHFPEGITIHDLHFRETGFAADFTGSFTCDDPFYNTLWQKAARTLYLTMRDNYMDCPDRERAQWWGDVVLELEEAFYALDRRSDRLTAKAVRELAAWQRPDSTVYSPVPSGNWNQELPMQMLASVGYYGFWTYFLHSGDEATLRAVYPAVERYLRVWELDEDGLVVSRAGGWTWGDWGQHKDMQLLYNGWYYLALKGFREMSIQLNRLPQVRWSDERMNRLAAAFNRRFWTGKAYRHPDYEGPTDDRAQALAVVSGIVPEQYYPALRTVFQEQKHASPYMEKYVLEALFQMGYPEDALARMKERFGPMVNSELTTLWEGWGIGREGYGGGTYNHAWSGGGLTLLSRYAAGLSPLTPAYETIRIQPQPGLLSSLEAIVPSPKGEIVVQWKTTARGAELTTRIPAGVRRQEVWLPVPPGATVELNGLKVYENQQALILPGLEWIGWERDYLGFRLGGGNWVWTIKNN